MLDTALVDKALAGDGKDADAARISTVQSAVVWDVMLAADTARIGIESGSTDVRLLGVYLLGVFFEQGPKALASIFEALRKAVKERWHSLRPQDGKEKAVDGSLSSLFRSMVNHVDVHDKMQDATFKAWSRLDHDTVGGPALRASAALREAIEEAIEGPRSTAPLSELDARVRAHFDRLPAPPKPAPPPPAPVAPPEVAAEEPAPALNASPAASSAPPEAAISAAESDHETDSIPFALGPPAAGEHIAVSPAFALLLKKIRAVESLIARGETERAAVVAEDVRRTLREFDPKVFFPDVFLPYFQLLSLNIDAIAPHWEQVGSPRWEALSQLYQVSLDVFAGG